jgi:hypothetical protein
MLNQSEKMHEHIFGTQFHQRLLNHLGALVGSVLVRSIEKNAYQKGRHDYLQMSKIALKELVAYGARYLRNRGKKSRFYEELKL